MLKLKNVSKYYYNKGVITSGFSKVSLDFNIGEFVAITGESGSGKSTLLNVISGLDSYEDGEMYIDGKETSHYTEKDYEKYRRKYIGNIFQNFNLVNSYTVYQNIELVLLINGKKKKDIKSKVDEIIKQVDLNKYRNRKVSKLSGGQKQRVAIARALAQNTPIILADEPTGNLDKKSSESVLKLLHELSNDKLVIVVTHNYDQIEEYVTRKITMYDGKVFEDKKIKDYEKVTDVKESDSKEIKWYNKLRLGIRNAFNILSKFLLLTTIYSFILFALFFVYSAFKESEYVNSNTGSNSYFNNISDKRIIIKKLDNSAFTEEDYSNIEKLDNVDKVIKDDLTLDITMDISNNDFYFNGTVESLKLLNGSVDIGRMPETDNEIVLGTFEDDYYVKEFLDELLSSTLRINNNFVINSKIAEKVKIVGIKFKDSSVDANDVGVFNYYNNILYFNDSIIDEVNGGINKKYSKVTYTFNGQEHYSNYGQIYDEILPSKKVKKGKVIIPEDWKMMCKDFKCLGKTTKIYVDNLYFKYNKSLKTYKYYNKKNLYDLTGYKYSTYSGAIFVNSDDYNNLFDKGHYQSTIMLKDAKIHEETLNELKNMGLSTLYIKDTLFNYDNELDAVLRIFELITMGLLVFVLFFVSYLIIKLILKSRNVYYSILRILGATSKNTKSVLVIELMTIAHLAYGLFILFIILSKNTIINISYINDILPYVTILDYVLLYIIVIVMTRLLANRYARKLFTDTVMNTYREEV